MRNNAMKTVKEKDKFFPWTEEDCGVLGIKRQEAHMAWRVLQGDPTQNAISRAGYPEKSTFDDITTSPTYARAVGIMSLQYLNAVAIPIAIRANVSIVKDTQAPAAARVRASSVLIEHAERLIERYTSKVPSNVEDMAPEALGKLIDHMTEAAREVLADVQIDGQILLDEDYLSDMS